MKAKYIKMKLCFIVLFLAFSWSSFSQTSAIRVIDFSVINIPTYNEENVQQNKVFVSFKVSDINNVGSVKLVFLSENNVVQSELSGTYSITENGYFFNFDGSNIKVAQYETSFELIDSKIITPQTKKVKLILKDKTGLFTNPLEFILL